MTQKIHKRIVEQVLQSDRIIITAHKSPDGDSIGSSLALNRFIARLGKKATICHPDPVAPFLSPFMAPSDEFLNFEQQSEQVKTLMHEADLIFMLDYNAPDRLGAAMGKELEAAKAFKIMIDHHLHPTDVADIRISEPAVCSTAQLIFELIDGSGNIHLLDEQTGTPIYLGIMTDSGSFRFPSVQARTHEVLAHLLNAGVEHHLIHEEIYDSNTLDRLKLRGYITTENLVLYPEYRTAVMHVTETEKKRFNYRDGDTEGLVNVALSIRGVNRAAFFHEKDGVVKISFRSKGVGNAVNTIASDHFGGGGHANAAGGKSDLSLDETIAKFLKVLPAYL